MSLHTILRGRWTLHLIAMAAVVAGLLVYNVTRVQARYNDELPYLVSTRASLRMCAQTSPALRGRAAAINGLLTASLQAVRRSNPYWDKAYGAASQPPALESACTVKLPTAALHAGDSSAVGLGVVTNPSPFRTIFLVLDEATADTVLGARKAAFVPYEMMQVGDHETAEVTSALVVRESAIGDPDVLKQQLPIAIGLYPEKPLGPPADEKSPTIKPDGYDS